MKRNIFIKNTADVDSYRPKTGGGSSIDFPHRDNSKHGKFIKNKLDYIFNQFSKEKNVVVNNSSASKEGTYIEFNSHPDFDLKTESLEDKRNGIKLLNIRKDDDDKGIVTKATVFVPSGKETVFIKKVEEYTKGIIKRKGSKNIAHTRLMSSIDDIKPANVESFWIGDKNWIPKDEDIWCEVWLSSNSEIVEEEFRKTVMFLDIDISEEKILFPERCVVCCKLNRSKLLRLIDNTNYIAEIRRASGVSSFFTDMYNSEQVEWSNDLLDRLDVDDNTNIVISILDTGVNRGHMLLSDFIGEKDCHCYKKDWENYDHSGHGTKMAGICLYNNLQELLESIENKNVTHRLESYKILPPEGENKPTLYGAITSQAISRLEIEDPNKKRVYCMAVTSPEYDTKDGSPSSWSAALDNTISGAVDDKKKLFIVSAGNIINDDYYKDYPVSNTLLSVQNPGQSWNAITIGGYTDLCSPNSLANCGGLSPYSTTSCIWDSKWPIKPEILFEGGNLIKEDDYIYGTDDLSLLTTSHRLQYEQFTTICGTSSATAQAAYMAAKLQSAYKDAWPETIRALMIHSAEWTENMKRNFLETDSKTGYKQLLRACGYGIPNLERAIQCKNNSVNMIIESYLQPFEKNGSNITFKDMNIHEIPWPKEFLLGLGDLKITMRVTLSYFIEPSPGEVGWKNKYKYQSCGLRFDVNGRNDKLSFKSKISKSIELNDESEVISSSVKWILGPNNRNVGSIHSDIWEDTAAELSTSNMIAVYPVGGWWKERHHLNKYLNKIRYSLVVSLSTPKEDIDLYTNISTEIKKATNIKIEV